MSKGFSSTFLSFVWCFSWSGCFLSWSFRFGLGRGLFHQDLVLGNRVFCKLAIAWNAARLEGATLARALAVALSPAGAGGA